MAASFVYVTATDRSEALRIGRALVEERLAACANVIDNVTSLYWWQGEREESREMLLLMKAPGQLVPRLRERIVELHSYEVPEVLEFHADSGLAAYMAWVAKSCEQ